MQGKVSVGLSTVTGYGVTTAAFVGAVLAYLGGDHSNQQLAIIACGVVGALAFAITNIGRQRQAVAITNQGPAATVITTEPTPTGGSVVVSSNAGAVTEGPGDPLPNELAAVPAPAVVPADVGDAEAAPNV